MPEYLDPEIAGEGTHADAPILLQAMALSSVSSVYVSYPVGFQGC
jgi:hypothetical protein